MVDPNAIVMQVNSGNVPPQWRVLRAKTGYFVRNGILYSVLGVAALIGLVVFFFSDTIFYYGPAPDPGSTGATVWFIIDLVVIIALAAVFLITGIRNLVGVGSAQQQMLVLMPEGFLVTTAKGVQSYPFGNINGMTAATQRGGDVVLTMRRADNGQQLKYTFDGRFGAPKTIAGSILSAQGQYATAMAQARQQPAQG
jgi:hypothetical protein